MQLPISPRKVTGALLIAVAVLTGLDLLFQTIRFTTGHESLLGMTRLFNLDEEANAPTWYASATLLASGLLLGLIAADAHQRGARGRWQWTLLAVVFVFLSLDETAAIHETVNETLEQLTVRAGHEVKWDLFSVALAAAMGAYCFRFVLELPARTRLLFIVGGALYVLGAAGIEIAGKAVPAIYDAPGFRKEMFTLVEELLEMLGIVVFIHALMLHLRDHVGEIHLTFRRERT